MKTVRIIPLGGSPQVTRNMFAYEYRNNGKIEDILLVDCGIGFPDESMYGVDYLVPDISYLKDKQRKIQGLVLTHGHMDHIGALKFILPQLNVPVYGTRLTAALAEADLREVGLKNQITVVDNDSKLTLGSFRVSFVHVTHSIPDAANLIIETPIGTFYHGSDYKFDWTPVDGRATEVHKIVQAAGKKGVLCLLSDCVRSEQPGYTLSEQVVEKSLQTEIQNSNGKFIFSTFSSNISRIQQAINVALENNRSICFLGRSIRKNVEVAKRLKYLYFPQKAVVKEFQLKKIPANQAALIVTGSQGEPASVLVRMANEEFNSISIGRGDTIVISADPIPGNETAVNNMINLLAAQEARVVYTDIHDELHVSGHASQADLSLMLGLTQPRFIIPMGGEYKQAVQYKELVLKMGYKEERIFLLGQGDILSFDEKGNANYDKPITLQNVMVDGLGIGDVGTSVLRDRNQLAEEGFVVIIVPYATSRRDVVGEVDIVSRGFVFHKEKETERMLEQAKKRVYQTIKGRKGRSADWHYLRRKISDDLGNFFYTELNRRPLILPVIVEV